MITYAVVLFLLAVLLTIMEVFLPSGGVLAAMAVAAAVASIVCAFHQSEAVGVIFLIIAIVVGPTLIIVGMKVFPKTPVGKRIILTPSVESANQRGRDGVAETDYSNLINQTGVAVTTLRPSGIVEINDERYSAVAQGCLINPNQKIIVINVEGNNIIVELDEDNA
ncbi:MAG: NfeD family protein [Sedimentisphaerales bacterium]|nr:NfeD family protein [Sedimentisphaerales bacterium]